MKWEGYAIRHQDNRTTPEEIHMKWEGYAIRHQDNRLGTGRVLTDLANADHTAGQILVQFHDGTRTRRWVEARNCTLTSTV